MEEFVEELKRLISFKETTDVGDTVLIAGKSEGKKTPDMLFYAHVIDIERDSSRRDEWWHIGLQLLSVPPQKVTWTLRTEQISGQEIFTMGGDPRFIKAVDFGTTEPTGTSPEEKKEKEGKVLTFKP